MSHVAAIEVHQLSKRYRLGQFAPYRTLRDALCTRWWRKAEPAEVGLPQGHASGGSQWLWALRDVSFTVERGEVVGIVGHNGAGKSTLLRILSRVTEPSSGRAWLHGRVGSLLEVRSGFHPELTGRENIYLYATILGMPRRTIEQRFDQIVEFAEVGPFLETPLKRFSSGMWVRLAFAVAAYLEPDILMLDETTAVGDANFREKCRQRTRELVASGHTILVVSHQMNQIRTLCDRVLVLDHGRLVADTTVDRAVDVYLGRTRHGEAEPPQQANKPALDGRPGREVELSAAGR